MRDKVFLFALAAYFFGILIGMTICSPSQAYDHIEYEIGFLPKSKHHGETDTTNESHNGITFEAHMPNGDVWGLIHYKNSYGDVGPGFYYAREYPECWNEFCIGAMIGLAPAYTESGHSPVIGGITIRWDWITIITVPTEVTTIKYTILEF